jgi:hypothetical protein
VVNALAQTLTLSPGEQLLLGLVASSLYFITVSIQEVMLLAMLRTIARDGVSAEPVLPVVRGLSASSGRHISNVIIPLLLLTCLLSHGLTLTEVCPIP